MITRILVVLTPLGLVAWVAGWGAFARRELSPIAAHQRAAVMAPIQDALKDTLVNLEKQSWQAWQRRDGAFFQAFLSDDHVEVGFHGVARKAAVVAGVASRACVVHSFAIDTFELTKLNPTTALLTYHAAQQTLCNGHAVPSPVWASSLYVRRGDRWLNAMYQQSQVLP
jgi:hypothetical protein